MSELSDMLENSSEFPEKGNLYRPTNSTGRNTVTASSYNANLNSHNDIAEKLRYENNDEEENMDAFPEDKNQNNDLLNKTTVGDGFDDAVAGPYLVQKKEGEEQYNFNKRTASLFERLLHPIQYGSLRGNIFGLSSMCLEAGSLVLAIRCEQFGLINFLIALALGGLLAYCTLNMMILAGKTTKETDYSKVVKSILGEKTGKYVDCNITIYLLGAVISFQVIIYQVIGAIYYDIRKIFNKNYIKQYENFENFKEEYWRKELKVKFPVMLGVAALVYPLCLIKDLSKMRIPSLIGVLALIYSIIVIIVESFFFLKKNNWDLISDMNWFDIRKAFSVDDGIPFFGGIATVFYIYSCHAGAFPVYKHLRENNDRRIKKVFRISIILDIMVYVSVAAASFITCPKNPPELILYRENLKGFDPDYFIILAKIGIVFNLFFSTPANYAGLRISLFQLIWGNSVITSTKNVIVTFIILLIVVVTGALYDEILEYIELLGGFCSVIYCFFIPMLIYVKSNKFPKTAMINIVSFSVLLICLIIGYTSGILTILFNMVKING